MILAQYLLLVQKSVWEAIQKDQFSVMLHCNNWHCTCDCIGIVCAYKSGGKGVLCVGHHNAMSMQSPKLASSTL